MLHYKLIDVYNLELSRKLFQFRNDDEILYLSNLQILAKLRISDKIDSL